VSLPRDRRSGCDAAERNRRSVGPVRPCSTDLHGKLRLTHRFPPARGQGQRGRAGRRHRPPDRPAGAHPAPVGGPGPVAAGRVAARRSPRERRDVPALPGAGRRGGAGRCHRVQVMPAHPVRGEPGHAVAGAGRRIDRLRGVRPLAVPAGSQGRQLRVGQGGIASVQLGLRVVLTEASRRGHGLADVARWMAWASADLVGLSGKGRTDVGPAPPPSRHAVRRPYPAGVGRPDLAARRGRRLLRPPGPPARPRGPGRSRAVEQESMTIQQRVTDAALQPRRN
jgi:hypothetical protein